MNDGKINRRFILRLFLCLIFSQFSEAQQYYFKNYSSDNGMPFVQVYCMFQDSRGYLYSGGYGGVCRFDGKEFVNITTKQGLADNYVNTIAEDDKGRILAGTKKGLSIINQEGSISKNFISERNVLCIRNTRDGTIYIGTDGGLYMFKNDNLSFDENSVSYQIKDLLFHEKAIYAATQKGLLQISEGQTKLFSTNTSGIPSSNITCVALSPDNKKLAIGTINGLSIFDFNSQKFSNYYVNSGLLDNQISSLLYETSGELWIGTHGGLVKLYKDNFTYYTIYYDNNSNLIRTLIKDYEGNLWVGTHSGMYRYRDDSFSTFDNISGPGNAFIFEIFKSGNELYLCSENNGIYAYSNGFFKRYGIKDGLPSTVCRSGASSKDGRLFFDSEGTLLELKNGKFEKITISKKSTGPYYKIFCDSKNQLWFGGTNGLAYLNLNKRSDTAFFPLPAKHGYFEITDIYEDSYGGLWVTAYMSGLYYLKDGVITDYGSKLGLEEIDFISSRCDNNYLYCATLNGLLVLNLKDQQYQFIKKEDGLISDIIYAIGFANDKKTLWVGTNLGVSEFDIESYSSTGKILINNYGKNEGFNGIESNTNGIFEDNDGTVWFGTVNGLIKYIPNRFKRNNLPNKQVIYKMKIGDSDTLLRNESEIPYKSNKLTFYFRGICLTNPDKVLYKTRLSGYDKKFSSETTENYVTYSNLEPGTYTLEIISCNNEGVWNEIPTTFMFTIKTPFYKTWWFSLLSIGSIVLLIYLVFKLRVNHLQQKQQKEFERKVEMSKVELKALRAQMNPHFVFNSLNSIQHYIYNSKSDEAVKYLNKFAKLMRVILNNSDKPTVTVEDDLEALKLYLELEKMRFEGKFDYTIDVDENVDMDYDVMPPMLLQPYVENAILHGLTPLEKKGHLEITIRSVENFILCMITDNGIGRRRAAEIKRTMPGSKHKSFGMKITEERLRILNEISMSEHSVKITDLYNPDGSSVGTRVELYIPIV